MKPFTYTLSGQPVKVNVISPPDLSGFGMGRADTAMSTVTINQHLPEAVQRTTLVHETIHQIADRFGIPLQESHVRCLESGFWDCLSQPKFLAALGLKKS